MLKRHRKWWKIAGIIVLVALGGVLLWRQTVTEAVVLESENEQGRAAGAGLREISGEESTEEARTEESLSVVFIAEESREEKRIAVHVSGSVTVPDIVVYLPPGSRVADAIEAAGGALPGAGLWKLNLARPVRDGERVYVPDAEEEWTETPYPAPGDAGGDSTPDSTNFYEESRGNGLTDLNKADKMVLEALPGIGPVLAARIIAYRAENGPFESIYELKNVKGIGEAVFGELAGLITVGEPSG